VADYYEDAHFYLGAQEYESAAALFAQLGEYRDAGEYALYCQALQAIADEEYALARATLKAVAPFKSSERYLDWLDALALEEDGRLAEALAAYEALGDFDKAWELLTSLTPKSEKDGLVTTASNKVRLLLLREKISEAEAMLDELRDAVAVVSAKNQKLGYSGKHYIRLYEIWLNILKEEDADLEFIEEEIRLSDNPVRNSELKLLLAKAWEDRGEDELAEELRLEAMSVGMGLWAENKARQQLTKE
jgi:hypothetical protein